MNLILPKGDRTEALLRLSLLFNQLDRAKAWVVDWKPYKHARTDAQNHALFGVAYKVLSDETGFTKDELHAAFCRKFFGATGKMVLDQWIIAPHRTTTRDAQGKRDVLSWSEFADFYDMVNQVAAEAGILIPEPDPHWRAECSAS